MPPVETKAPTATTFWMVWNPEGHMPRRKHATVESARQEAERLAVANPGTEFCVLAFLGSCTLQSPVTWTFPSDGLPF